MKILAVDSTSVLGGVAILDDETVLAEIPYDRSFGAGIGAGGQSQFLLPAIHQALSQTGLSLSEIELLSAATGPGSFTGIRVGIALLKGLFHQVSIPAVSILSLDAVAFAQAADGYVCPVIDARMGEVYAAVYKDVEPVEGPWAIEPEALAARFVEQKITPLLVGTGTAPYQKTWKDYGLIVDDFSATSTAPAVGVLGFLKLAEGEARSIEELSPFYLRESEAERQWNRRHSDQATSSQPSN